MVNETVFDLLTDYIEVYGRPRPIKYDVLTLSDEHRKFDALMRRYWNGLHPLSRDLFTSFANEFQYLQHQVKQAEEKIKLAEQEISQIKDEYDQKWLELDSEFENKVIDQVAEIKNKQFDKIALENKELKLKIKLLNEKLQDQKEINKHIRQEMSLLIDDSENNEKSKAVLENNIQQSVQNFSSFAKQLDFLEKELNAKHEENNNGRLVIQRLKQDLDQKNRDLQVAKSEYKKMFEKLKLLTPKIEEMQLKIQNLEAENRQLKANNQNSVTQPSKNIQSKPSAVLNKPLFSKPTVSAKVVTTKPPDLLSQINETDPSKNKEELNKDPFQHMHNQDSKIIKTTMLDSIKQVKQQRNVKSSDNETQIFSTDPKENKVIKSKRKKRKRKKHRKTGQLS